MIVHVRWCCFHSIPTLFLLKIDSTWQRGKQIGAEFQLLNRVSHCYNCCCNELFCFAVFQLRAINRRFANTGDCWRPTARAEDKDHRLSNASNPVSSAIRKIASVSIAASISSAKRSNLRCLSSSAARAPFSTRPCPSVIIRLGLIQRPHAWPPLHGWTKALQVNSPSRLSFNFLNYVQLKPKKYVSWKWNCSGNRWNELRGFCYDRPLCRE